MYLHLSAVFVKGNRYFDFLFASIVNKILPAKGLILKERICSSWSKFCPFRIDPIGKGGKNENDRVVSPEMYPFTLMMHAIAAMLRESLYRKIV